MKKILDPERVSHINEAHMEYRTRGLIWFPEEPRIIKCNKDRLFDTDMDDSMYSRFSSNYDMIEVVLFWANSDLTKAMNKSIEKYADDSLSDKARENLIKAFDKRLYRRICKISDAIDRGEVLLAPYSAWLMKSDKKHLIKLVEYLRYKLSMEDDGSDNYIAIKHDIDVATDCIVFIHRNVHCRGGLGIKYGYDFLQTAPAKSLFCSMSMGLGTKGSDIIYKKLRSVMLKRFNDKIKMGVI